jgi:hypothetical protein
MPSTSNSYFLVALSPVVDLLLCAKHLFIAASAGLPLLCATIGGQR